MTVEPVSIDPHWIKNRLANTEIPKIQTLGRDKRRVSNHAMHTTQTS
jgi:hypothetical protein